MELDEKTQELFGKEKMGKLLFMMSFPVIVAVAISAIYNVVDTIFIGRAVGYLGVAGIGIGFPVQLMVNSLGILLGMGGMSIVSRFLGASKQGKANEAVGQVYLSTIILSLVLAAGLLFLDDLVTMLGANPEVFPYAREYVRIILPGSVFVLMSVAAGNLLMSQGKPGLVMIQLVSGAVLNIALDPLFIFVFNMGVTGAAVATVISQGLSLGLVLYFQFSDRTVLAPKLRHFLRFRPALAGRIILLGVPGFLQEIGLSVLIVVVNNMIVRTAADSVSVLLAVFGIINRLMFLMVTPVIGIAQGFMPIAGFNFGAGDERRLKEAYRWAVFSSLVITSVLVVVACMIPEILLSWFTMDPNVIAAGVTPLRLMFSMLPAVAVLVVVTFYFMGIDKPVPAIAISLSRQVLFFIPVVVLLSRILGETGIWLSFPTSDILTLGLAMILFYGIRRIGK